MTRSTIAWFRRDLRMADNPALAAAGGGPVIPLYVLDETEGLRPPGAAGKWWLDKSLRALSEALQARGSRLVLRRGPAAAVVAELARETGAERVVWNRLYDPGVVERDRALKADLGRAGLQAESFNAGLLVEPWQVRTKGDEPFKVFTPFWRAARALVDPGEAARIPTLPAPERWPRSDPLDSWGLHPTGPDWSAGFTVWTPGEAGAQAALRRFVDGALADYADGRARPAQAGSSRLSPHLHWGEIGPRQVWRSVASAVKRGAAPEGQAEKFFAELGWREFNHQLLFHRPDLGQANFKARFDHLAWRRAPAELDAWRRGRTGYPIVDAGMRELWATGWMHNRVRLIAASFLVKDLLIDWREGERWFWDTLVDADEANNVGNWQWVAGTGADAAPFFRIFNPTTQGERFDPCGDYVRRWVPELGEVAPEHVHAPWLAGGAPGYPPPIVDHASARDRALAALRDG
jgi:deoxyribodipyrimidine photo-lyase